MERPWTWPAHVMLERLETRDVSSVDLVSSCLDRIDAVNPQINAVVVIDRERSLAEAKAADDARASRGQLGALAGLPFTAKLDFDVAGEATSEGTSVQRDALAAADGPIIERMREAGAVLLGRTNQPDFGIVYHTNSTLYGLTKNPWAEDRSPGGSSGGEGAAVATGMSPLGLGSDIGGSIRGPASFNGVVGLKPGLGRYPDALQTQAAPPIHEQLFTGRGPIARSVKDIVLADQVLRGVHHRDPWTAPVPATSERATRIGVVFSPTDAPGSEQIAGSVRRASEVLAGCGYHVEETSIPGWQDLYENFRHIMSAGFGGDRSSWHLLHPDTQSFLEHVHDEARKSASNGQDLGLALARRHELGVRFYEFHRQFDVLIMPTWADKTFMFDELKSPEGIERTLAVSRHLYLFNLLGLPGMSVPIGLVDGLPAGLHISSTRYREDAVLQVGLDVEDALGPLAPIDPR